MEEEYFVMATCANGISLLKQGRVFKVWEVDLDFNKIPHIVETQIRFPESSVLEWDEDNLPELIKPEGVEIIVEEDDSN